MESYQPISPLNKLFGSQLGGTKFKRGPLQGGLQEEIKIDWEGRLDMKNRIGLVMFGLVMIILSNNCTSQRQNAEYSPHSSSGTRNDEVSGKIAFWALTWPEVGEYPSKSLKVVNLDGTGLLPLTKDSYGYRLHYADWSPDGSMIAYSDYSTGSANNGSYDIYVVDVKSQIRTQLTQTKGNYYKPKWSPDGGKIAFASSEASPELGGIYTIKPDGTELIPFATESESKSAKRNVVA